MASAFLGFVVVYMLGAGRYGDAAGAPSMLFVLATGYFFGIAAGIAAGAMAIPLAWWLASLPFVQGPDFNGFDLALGILLALVGAAGGGIGRLQSNSERLLKESRRLGQDLRHAQRIAHMGYWELAPDGGIQWSEELYRVFGFDAPPTDLETAYARIHPDDRKKARDQIDALWQTGEDIEDEERLLMPDGSMRWLAYWCHAEKDPDGRTVRLFGTTQDITQMKQAKRADKNFRDLLDHLEESYWTVDLVHQKGNFSAGCRTIYGREPAEFRADLDLWRKVILEEDLPTVDTAMAPLFQGRNARYQYRIRRPDGKVRWVESTTWPELDGTRVVGLFGIVRDVTVHHDLGKASMEARRQAVEVRKLKELDEFKALFLNAAAHELNTPLTPLKLQARMLVKKYPDEKAPQVVQRNVARLEVLVGDLLDASRLQSGRLKFDLVDLDMHQVLVDVAHEAAPQAAGKDLAMSVDIGTDLVVHGDPVRIAQVATNLVQNAIKFTPGGESIEVTARHEGNQVVLRMADTGLGLDPDDIRGLFQPFAQFHRDEVGLHLGTGLGLFITRGIVEAMGGTIEAASPGRGQGATFTVRLPAA